MKKCSIIIFFLCGLFFLLPRSGADDEDVPEGMEILTFGPAQILVPEGMKMKREGGLVVLENINKYIARRLFEMENELVKVKVRNEALTEEVQRLEQVMDEMQRAMDVLGKGD